MKKKTKKAHAHAEKEHCIVKRAGHCEAYDERKVYGSVYGACMTAQMNEKDCEKMAGKISKSTTKLVHKKKEISSGEISQHVAKELKKHSKDAAFMYETHRDIS